MNLDFEKMGGRIPAVVFGKALYEGHITMKDLKRFM